MNNLIAFVTRIFFLFVFISSGSVISMQKATGLPSQYVNDIKITLLFYTYRTVTWIHSYLNLNKKFFRILSHILSPGPPEKTAGRSTSAPALPCVDWQLLWLRDAKTRPHVFVVHQSPLLINMIIRKEIDSVYFSKRKEMRLYNESNMFPLCLFSKRKMFKLKSMAFSIYKNISLYFLMFKCPRPC